MSSYLNSKKASLLYKDEALATYFVDKTAMLDELIPVIEQTELTDTALHTDAPLKGKSNKYICVTRPRRFGKSTATSMIAAYLGKGRNTRPVFDHLAISSREWYLSHLSSR